MVVWLWRRLRYVKRVEYTRFGSGAMFDNIANYYDWMNRVISLVIVCVFVYPLSTIFMNRV